MNKKERKPFKAEVGKSSQAALKETVRQFEKITRDMCNLEAGMRGLSAQKLLEEFLARDRDPQAIYSFFRVVEELHQAWAGLLEKGKAPTRKALGDSAKNTTANTGIATKEGQSKKPGFRPKQTT
jgi:hypothetical protein